MPDIFIEPKPEEKITPKPAEISPKKSHSSVMLRLQQDVPETTISPFTSFCEKPAGVTFQTERPNEHILLFLKKHFVTNIPWIAATVILLFLPALITIASTLFESPFNLPTSFVQILTLLYYLVVFGYAFVNFITWFYNIMLVTGERVIDIDFSEIVFHDVAETKLNLVEDVNYTQSGVIRTFFNYGDVFVQTAGGKENLEAIAIPQPGRAVRIIGDLIGKGSHSG